MSSFSLKKSLLAVAIGASMSSLAFAGVTSDNFDNTGAAGTTVVGAGATVGVGTGAENLRASSAILVDPSDATQGYYIVTELQHVTVTTTTQGTATFDEDTGNLTLAPGNESSYAYSYAQRQQFNQDGTPVLTGGNPTMDYGYILTNNGDADFDGYQTLGSATLDPTDLAGSPIYNDATHGINGNPNDQTDSTFNGGKLTAHEVVTDSLTANNITGDVTGNLTGDVDAQNVDTQNLNAYKVNAGQANAPVPAVPESAPGAGDGVAAIPGSGAVLTVNPDNSTASLGSINAAGHLNGIQTSATGTLISGGTTSTGVQVGDNGVTLGQLNSAGTGLVAGSSAQVHGVAAGTAANDAVNFGQMSAGDAALQGQVNGLNGRVDYLHGQVKDLKEDAFSGIASAIALSSAQMPSAPGKTAVSIGGGFYKSEQAVGLNVVHAVSAWGNNNGTIGFGVASGTSGGNTAGKLSVGFEF